MKLFTSFLVSFIFLGLQTSSFAQTATVSGKVTDASNGSPCNGVKVSVVGKAIFTLTDFNGAYLLSKIPAGVYTIEFKSTEYKTKQLTEFAIKENEQLTLDVELEMRSQTTQGVTVTKYIKKDTQEGAVLMQRKSPVLLDVVPAEVITRSPARTASDALSKVSGASIQDNKFAVIRGLNDRYNAAYLNDAPLPSSESDRKAFSFDIFPVNMLENLAIVKTASADLPGEFAGGIILVKTKDVPLENFNSLSIGGGYNTITSFKKGLSAPGGKLDWLGLDDGTRAIPSSIPANVNYPTSISAQADLAKTFTTTWGLDQKMVIPNFSLQYATGFKKKLKTENREFGYTASISYNRTNNLNQTKRNSYTDNAGGGSGASQIESAYIDQVNATSTLSGAMLNLGLKWNENHLFTLKNLYSINSDLRIIQRTGEVNPLDPNPTLIRSNANWLTTNQIFASQLGGQHVIKKSVLKADWTLGMSSIKRTIPNMRRSIYSRLQHFNDPNDPNPYDTTWIANISQSNCGPDYGGNMFFSENKEWIASAKANLTYEFAKKKKNSNAELKAGFFIQERQRDFTARQFGYTKYGAVGGSISFDYNLLYLPEDQIFSSQNMGLIAPGVGGFKLTEGTKASDSYTASTHLKAGYVSMYNKIHKHKFIYGVRIEDFQQSLSALKADKTPLNVEMHNVDILPSINYILDMKHDQFLRFSASQTVNRPEYRELAPFAFYDFNTQFVLSGNDSLKRAKITNLDLRYEWYPSKGALVSVSTFYKNFQNPIEQIARPDVLNEISYKNVGVANNVGIELEVKSNVGKLFKVDSTNFLNQIQFFSNLGFIHSVVDVSQNIGTPYQFRPLQGQSPYVFNLGATYQKETFSVSMNVNRVGSRIYILGSVLQPDIWEKGRTFLDLQVARSFLDKKLDVKINCQNLLAQHLIFYQNNYFDPATPNAIRKAGNYLFTGEASGENRFDISKDDLVWDTNFGRVFSFVLTYKF
jgi:TonB-dependent receptor